MVIKGYDVVALLKKTWSEIGKDKISVYAAQMAYAMFFSLFPLLLFFVALLSIVVDRKTATDLINGRALAALPAGVSTLLAQTVEKVVLAKGAPGILSFGLLTAAWSGSGVFGALRAALNDAYDVEETRPWWKQYALQLAMLAVAGVILLAATVILLNGEGVMNWLGDHLHLGPVTTILWTIVQFPLAIAALIAVLWMQYYFLPNCRNQSKKILLLGAAIATALWLVATLLFRAYVQKFNALNPAYGAIGAIMVLLTWMYYSAFVLLAVGELSSEIEQGSGRVDRVRERAESERSAVPREHALVPVGAHPRAPEPRWAARLRARAEESDGRRGLKRFALFRVVDRVQDTIAFTRDWVEGVVAHLRADVSMARREIAGALRGIGRGMVFTAVAAVLALLGTLSLVTGIVLLAGDQWLPRNWYWLAGLLLAILAGLAAAVTAGRGRGLLAEGIAPEQTLTTLREDREALTEALK